MHASRKGLVWRRRVLAYCKSREIEPITDAWKKQIRRTLLRAGEELDRAGLVCNPRFFGQEQVNFLFGKVWFPKTKVGTGYADTTRSFYWIAISEFLRRSGCTSRLYGKVFPRSAPQSPRQALTLPQARRVLKAARRRGWAARALVTFELSMGLRRKEVIGLSVGDVSPELTAFIGKGRNGGKRRELPTSEPVRKLLPRLLKKREKRLRKHGLQSETGPLLCHVRDGVVKGYSLSWADRTMRRIFDDVGVKQKGNLHHALRRTFGRLLWERGVPTDAVGDLLGHRSLETTRKYLALNIEDLRAAVSVLDTTLSGSRGPIRIEPGRRWLEHVEPPDSLAGIRASALGL